MPPPVRRLPLCTKRGWPAATLISGNCFRQGMKAQWVVASYPLSSPAAANSNAPSHTEATMRALALCWTRKSR